jgi:hypothetical protein
MHKVTVLVPETSEYFEDSLLCRVSYPHGISSHSSVARCLATPIRSVIKATLPNRKKWK